MTGRAGVDGDPPGEAPGEVAELAALAALIADQLVYALRSSDLAEDVTGGALAEDGGADGDTALLDLEDGRRYEITVRRVR